MPQKPAENTAPPGRVEHPTIGLEGPSQSQNPPENKADRDGAESGVTGGVTGQGLGDHVLHNVGPHPSGTDHAVCAENPGSEARADTGEHGQELAEPDQTTGSSEVDQRASAFVTVLHDLVTAHELAWHAPHRTYDPDRNEAALEWHARGRSLAVFVTVDSIVGIRGWGPNIHTQMGDFDTCSAGETLEAYRWLLDALTATPARKEPV